MSDMINQAKIIPVLDIMGGLVVHGVAGEREKYKPVSGSWVLFVVPPFKQSTFYGL